MIALSNSQAHPACDGPGTLKKSATTGATIPVIMTPDARAFSQLAVSFVRSSLSLLMRITPYPAAPLA
jgi:hypothetical protein